MVTAKHSRRQIAEIKTDELQVKDKPNWSLSVLLQLRGFHENSMTEITASFPSDQ